MTPRKSTGSAVAAESTLARSALERFFAWFAHLRDRRDLPALKIPSHPEVRPVHASWLSAFWPARAAVRAGVPLDTFLQHRLVQHLARTCAPERLGMTLWVDGAGTLGAAPAERPPPLPWIESFLRAAGPEALNPEILAGQADAARLAVRIESQRARADELTRAAEQALHDVELVDPGDERQAQQMGRPPVPPPTGAALLLSALALLLAESWQLAVPCLELAGIQTAALATELQRDAVPVLMACAFAVGASATLFLLAHVALRQVLDGGDRQAPGRRLWSGVTSACAVALILGLAWSIASLRHGAGQTVDMSYARETMFLVLIAIPFTGAWLMGLAREAEQERARARALARAWDREHYRTFTDVSRRAASAIEEQQALAALEAEREAVVQRIRRLQRRSATARRLAEDATALERQAVARALHGIAAALDRDRYEYVRYAAAHGIRVARPEQAAPVLPSTFNASGAAMPATAAVRSGREVPEHNLGLAG